MQQAVAAFKRGDRGHAKQLLRQVLQADPQNEQAWLWMSGATANRDEQRYCLERVLAINPASAAAQRGLAALATSAPPAPTSTPVAPPAPSPIPIQPAVLQPMSAAPATPPPVEPQLQASRAAPLPAPVPVPSTPAPPPAPKAVPAASPPARRRGDDSYWHKVNARVGAYQIVERVGQHQGRELYLASQADPNWQFWLLCTETPPQLAIRTKTDEFASDGLHYLAFPVAGTTVAALYDLLPAVRFRFIGPRWVQFADHLGYLHKNNAIYQQNVPFTLENIIFDGNGTATAVSYNRSSANERVFSAPETGQQKLTPAADVYALGASLLALMGQGTSEAVFARGAAREGMVQQHPRLYDLLRKATDPVPTARHKNGEEFARALEQVLGKLPSEAEEHLAKPRRRSKALPLVFGAVITTIIITLGLFLLMTRSSESVAVEGEADGVAQRALPTGLLSIASFAIAEDDDGGTAQVRVLKGGEELPAHVPISFVLERNREPVGGQRTEEVSPGFYRVGFSAPDLSGMYKLIARLDDAETSAQFYYAPGGDDFMLDTVVAEGLQIDVGNYPELTTYFGIVTVDGEAAELLGEYDIELLQDGQPVQEFAMSRVDPAAEPVTAALAIDVSGSMRGEPLALAKQAAAEFVRQLGANDSSCLYIFATQVQKLVDCTTDHAQTLTAIEGLETIDDTALYDALTRVTSDQAGQPGRHAVVVLSDGADTKSSVSLDTALDEVRRSNLPVYTIGLLSEQFDGSVLQRMATEADAIYLEAPKAEDMFSLYSTIEQQLESQYRITFRSIYPDRREGEITIRITKDDTVIEVKRQFAVLN